jgi:hypothetical protein
VLGAGARRRCSAPVLGAGARRRCSAPVLGAGAWRRLHSPIKHRWSRLCTRLYNVDHLLATRKVMQNPAKTTQATGKPLPVGVESKAFPLFFNRNFHKEGGNEDPPNKRAMVDVGNFIKTLWNKHQEEYARLSIPEGFKESGVNRLPPSLLPLAAQCYTADTKPIPVLVNLEETADEDTCVIVVRSRSGATAASVRVYEPTNDMTRAALACTIRVTQTSNVCNFHPWFATAIFSTTFSWETTCQTNLAKTDKFPQIMNGGISVDDLRKRFVRTSPYTKFLIAVVPAPYKTSADLVSKISIDIANATTEQKKEHLDNFIKAFPEDSREHFMRLMNQFVSDGATKPPPVQPLPEPTHRSKQSVDEEEFSDDDEPKQTAKDFGKGGKNEKLEVKDEKLEVKDEKRGGKDEKRGGKEKGKGKSGKNKELSGANFLDIEAEEAGDEGEGEVDSDYDQSFIDDEGGSGESDDSDDSDDSNDSNDSDDSKGSLSSETKRKRKREKKNQKKREAGSTEGSEQGGDSDDDDSEQDNSEEDDEDDDEDDEEGEEDSATTSDDSDEEKPAKKPKREPRRKLVRSDGSAVAQISYTQTTLEDTVKKAEQKREPARNNRRRLANKAEVMLNRINDMPPGSLSKATELQQKVKTLRDSWQEYAGAKFSTEQGYALHESMIELCTALCAINASNVDDNKQTTDVQTSMRITQASITGFCKTTSGLAAIKEKLASAGCEVDKLVATMNSVAENMATVSSTIPQLAI